MRLEPNVPPEVKPSFSALIAEVFGKTARDLGWMPKAGESESTRKLRPVLVSAVAREGRDETLTARAREMTEQYLADPASVPADVAPHALFVSAARGDRALLQRYRAAFVASQDQMRRQFMSAAIGRFEEKAAVEAALALLLDPEIDIRQVLFMPFGLRANDEVQQRLWDFTKRNVKRLLERFPEESVPF